MRMKSKQKHTRAPAHAHAAQAIFTWIDLVRLALADDARRRGASLSLPMPLDGAVSSVFAPPRCRSR